MENGGLKIDIRIDPKRFYLVVDILDENDQIPQGFDADVARFLLSKMKLACAHTSTEIAEMLSECGMHEVQWVSTEEALRDE